MMLGTKADWLISTQTFWKKYWIVHDNSEDEYVELELCEESARLVESFKISESSQIEPENVDLNESFVEAFNDANFDDTSSSETEYLPADVTASRPFPVKNI